MANQYPQPEVYTTTHPFASSGTALGSTDSQTIYTNIAHNEQVLIYGVMVNFYEDRKWKWYWWSYYSFWRCK